MGHSNHHCCCENCNCGCHENHGSCSCSCHDCHDHSDEKECCYSEAFLELADEAWMEVLKDKIKENILANDKKINELAAIVAEANHARWKKKMDDQNCCDGYKEKLHNFFHQCDTKPRSGK